MSRNQAFHLKRNMAFRYGPYTADTLEELEQLKAAYPEHQKTGALSFKQAKVIGLSVGGKRALCPQYLDVKKSFQDVLLEMGLTGEAASRVLSAMTQAGVKREHQGIPFDVDKAARAQAILFEVGGIACPVAPSAPSRSPRASAPARVPSTPRAAGGEPRYLGGGKYEYAGQIYTDWDSVWAVFGKK